MDSRHARMRGISRAYCLRTRSGAEASGLRPSNGRVKTRPPCTSSVAHADCDSSPCARRSCACSAYGPGTSWPYEGTTSWRALLSLEPWTAQTGRRSAIEPSVLCRAMPAPPRTEQSAGLDLLLAAWLSVRRDNGPHTTVTDSRGNGQHVRPSIHAPRANARATAIAQHSNGLLATVHSRRCLDSTTSEQQRSSKYDLQPPHLVNGPSGMPK